MGLFRRLSKLFCAFVAVVAILLGPSPLPDSVKFTEFDVTTEKGYREEQMSRCVTLNNVERMFEGEVKGPEAFEVLNGDLYTTLHGGFVAKVYDDQVVPVVKFGEECVGWYEESKCGRPLGIKALGSDHLVVADAYYGIFKHNIKTHKSVNLVPKNQPIDGKIPHIFNGVEVSKDGTIYWTHSSSDFTIQDGIYTFLADGSGRLLKYDPVTRTNQVLLKDLFFPNGVVLSPDEDHLLISETGQSRILKYHLKGPKKFTTEVFVDGLPGAPDNLRRDGNDGYYIPLVITKDEMHPLLFQLLSKFPSVRKFAARLLSLIEFSLQEVDKLYPNYYTKRAVHFVGHLESIGIFLSSKTTILRVSLDGRLIESYHCSDGTLTSVSDVIRHNGKMYFGSPTNNYLGRVSLPGAELDGRRLTRPPPTTTTTTTARPTTTTRPPPPPVTTSRPSTTRPPTTTTTTTRPPPRTTQTPKSPPKQPEGQKKPNSLS